MPTILHVGYVMKIITGKTYKLRKISEHDIHSMGLTLERYTPGEKVVYLGKYDWEDIYVKVVSGPNFGGKMWIHRSYIEGICIWEET